MSKRIFLFTITFILLVPILALGSRDNRSILPEGEYTGCTLRANFRLGEESYHRGDEISSDTHEDWGIICMVGAVHHVVNWVFYLLVVIVTIMVLYGALTFMTSAGDPSKTTRATRIITFAVVGMIVALLARIIPAAVIFITGLS